MARSRATTCGSRPSASASSSSQVDIFGRRLIITQLPLLLAVPLVVWTFCASLAAAEEEGTPPLSGVTRGTVVLTRTADDGAIAAPLFSDQAAAASATEPEEPCTFPGGHLLFAHPASLKPADRFFSTGQLQLKAMEMMIDRINVGPRCGLYLESTGMRYGLTLRSYGDDSSKDKIEAIAKGPMTSGAGGDPTNGKGFWLGPYSSGLTGSMAPVANGTNTVLVAGGAASTPVFRDRPTVFGTFPPTGSYLAQAVEALAQAGARTVASVWEDASFTRGVCGALPSLLEGQQAKGVDMTLQSAREVPAKPTADEHLNDIARELSSAENDPDVVVTCVYAAGCAEWVSALRSADWSPRAQVFTVCIGMDSFVEAVGNDAEFMMGVSPWDPSLPMRDTITELSAAEFASEFYSTTARAATYHAASAAASVVILAEAIERAGSLDHGAVAAELADGEFTTLYGKITFNSNGQSAAPSLVLQYDGDGSVQTVFPDAQSSGDLMYPMPTWNNRDCVKLSRCGATEGSEEACDRSGKCQCPDPSQVSMGTGADAKCVVIPEEDYSYISSGLKGFGLSLFALQTLVLIVCSGWTFYYRKRRVVQISQPGFLQLICFGCFVVNLSIIPLMIQGEYRYEQDPVTKEMTDIKNDDIAGVDAACMAFPWLFGVGFVIVFSALFAKIWRVKLIFKHAEALQRKQVKVQDVALIMLVLLLIEVAILLSWQLVDPLRWQREVKATDPEGFPTQSVGSCQSEDGVLRFLLPLLIFNGICLLYALYLSFITRNVPSSISEGKWLTASIISIVQIMIVSIPILIIVEDDSDAFYFVRAAVVFLLSLTITLLIFVPKMHRLHVASQESEESRNKRKEQKDRLSQYAVSRRDLSERGMSRGASTRSAASARSYTGGFRPGQHDDLIRSARESFENSMRSDLSASRNGDVSGVSTASDADRDSCAKEGSNSKALTRRRSSCESDLSMADSGTEGDSEVKGEAPSRRVSFCGIDEEEDKTGEDKTGEEKKSESDWIGASNDEKKSHSEATATLRTESKQGAEDVV